MLRSGVPLGRFGHRGTSAGTGPVGALNEEGDSEGAGEDDREGPEEGARLWAAAHGLKALQVSLLGSEVSKP